MKIVNISGGLGNQMFQVAFASSLKNYFPDDEIVLDTHHYTGYNFHNGFEVSTIFPNEDFRIANALELRKLSRYIPNYKLSRVARKFLPTKKTEFVERSNYVYDPDVYNTIGDVYYEGFWQAARYYLPLRESLIELFSFPSPSGANQEIAEMIKSRNSVGIHVRRGDYLNLKEYKGICDLEYYQTAIKKLCDPSKSYFVFSNDSVWCQKELMPLFSGNQSYLVNINSEKRSFWDMYLMSLCKSLIIANSSFSWWSAFLNKRAERVISPKKWINTNKSLDIHCPVWETI